MSANKRPRSSLHQRGITSYFPTTLSTLSDVTTDDPHFTSLSSIVPEHTPQQTLFQVGMKVRKAMADSYISSKGTYSYHRSGANIRDAYYSPSSSQDQNSEETSSQESALSTSIPDDDDRPKNLKRRHENEDEDEPNVDEQTDQQGLHAFDSMLGLVASSQNVRRPSASQRRGKRSTRRFHIAVERSFDAERVDNFEAVENGMDEFEDSEWLNAP